MKTNGLHAKKPKSAPAFWWDFSGDEVIVQSDWPGGERLAAFTGEHAIDDAASCVRRLQQGIETPNWHRAASRQGIKR